MRKKSVWKQATALALALGLSLSSSMMSFAGTWQKLEGGKYWQWKYVEDDGSYTTNNWQQIDGKWYHFNADGYLDVGMKEFDGKVYNLMPSGALETNKDYGFASSDENGVWTLKTFSPLEQEENTYAEYCKKFGIDIDGVLWQLGKQSEYTFSCPLDNFPKDSEGEYIYAGVVDCIIAAMEFDCLYYAHPTNPCSIHWEYNRANNIFTMTFKNTASDYPIIEH